MLNVIIGQSEDTLELEAAKDVLGQIKKQMPDQQPSAGILFCSIDYNHELILRCIKDDFPDMDLIGCTTDGEIASISGFTDDSVVLVAFASDTVEFASGIGHGVSTDGVAAGRHAASQCVAKLRNHVGNPSFAIILTDPISAGISGVDTGIKSVLGEHFPVIGGVSAAHSKQRKTHQLFQDNLETDSVVLMLFAGDVHFSIGIKGGHSPLGTREQVSHVENNAIYRIGDRRAYDYFRHYIGDYDLFMNYCLAVFQKKSDEFYVLSAPKSDPEQGIIYLNGPIENDAEVQIGTADKNAIASSCLESITSALDGFKGRRARLALFFSCAGRKMIMGTKIVEEAECARRLLPDIPYAGFYCYGEFAPLAENSPFHFHGTTFVTLLIGD